MNMALRPTTSASARFRVRLCKRRIDLSSGVGGEGFDLSPDGRRRRLRLLDHGLGIPRPRIDEERKARGFRNKLVQEPEALGPKLPAKTRDPVALPPGRLRLATRPVVTGSPVALKTIGIVAGCGFDRERRIQGCCDDDAHSAADKLGRQFRHPTTFIVRPGVFDGHVAALDVARFAQAFAECRHKIGTRLRRAGWKYPTTAIAGCCARATSGHAAAAPPSSVMNVRLLTRSPRRR